MNNTSVTVNPIPHPVQLGEDGSMVIHGYGLDPENCFLMQAFGHRYHDYGIADGSYLLCSLTKPPRSGDLVIVMAEDTPTVYLYRPRSKEDTDGEKRILKTKTNVYATILCSLNFYH